MFPEKFNNKTNGVTPRRWIRKANSKLSQLVSDTIGKGWVKDLAKIKALEKHASDSELQRQWQEVKKSNKERLALIIKDRCGVTVDTNSLFDVQVKRIHEYKRQLLNVMHCIYLYHQIKDNPNKEFVPRTVIFGGKAAPGYYMAKLIINLINNVGNIVNNDPAVRNLLKVVFIPNYGVSLAETIIPGANLSEQISTAGYEASGTGNMKFAMNGALTIGTLDGANVEMQEEIGAENIFIFGHTVDQLRELGGKGYNPWHYYHSNPDLRRILDAIQHGHFSQHEHDLFKPIVDQLLTHGDRFFHLADFQLYIEEQQKVNSLYLKTAEWQSKSILNVARMSKFSSDRTIQEYASQIWKVGPCHIENKQQESLPATEPRRKAA
jgi:starch phosphorylase